MQILGSPPGLPGAESDINTHFINIKFTRWFLWMLKFEKSFLIFINTKCVYALKYSFTHTVVVYGCETWTIKKAECQRIDAFELWCLKGGENSWESLGLQGDPTSPSERKSVLNIHWKDWYWSWKSNTLATWCEELTHLKRPWCWARLRAVGEGNYREWDGLMAYQPNVQGFA